MKVNCTLFVVGARVLWWPFVVIEVADLQWCAPDQTQLCKYWGRPNWPSAITVAVRSGIRLFVRRLYFPISCHVFFLSSLYSILAIVVAAHICVDPVRWIEELTPKDPPATSMTDDSEAPSCTHLHINNRSCLMYKSLCNKSTLYNTCYINGTWVIQKQECWQNLSKSFINKLNEWPRYDNWICLIYNDDYAWTIGS